MCRKKVYIYIYISHDISLHTSGGFRIFGGGGCRCVLLKWALCARCTVKDWSFKGVPEVLTPRKFFESYIKIYTN